MKTVFIIAEAGVNHNGNLDLALQLVDAAAAAGVDAVKFQTFKATSLVSKFAPKAEYQKAATNKNESQLEMIRRLELSDSDHEALLQHCQARGIMFLSTPFDLESMEFLLKLGIPMFKVGSGELTNLPYLRKIAAFALPLILSTGMSTLQEVKDAVEVLEKAGLGRDKIILLHCNTEYPTPDEDVNLRAMQTLKEAFPGLGGIGYSDHSQGNVACYAAVALGARVIEKHFTLDRNLPGPDHKSSLEPGELAELVAGIRRIETMLGSGEKVPSASELPNRVAARKSIVAAAKIAKGEVFSETNITVKRPGNGISPMRWDELIGQKAIRSFSPDELIEI